MELNKSKFILIFLVVLLVFINYTSIDGFLEKTFLDYDLVEVERVVDGDTVIINGTSVRLLGINSPEKGEKYYNEAKNFLESLVMNKSIGIKREGKDRYNRELAYLFYEDKNLNLEIVKNGFANHYFPSGKDRYYERFVLAWQECSKNLCEKSNNICASCLDIELNVKEDEIFISNICSFHCDLNNWIIKDEGRKKFVFSDFVLKSFEKIKITSKDFEEDYVLTKSGDSIFLRDSDEKMILWEIY